MAICLFFTRLQHLLCSSIAPSMRWRQRFAQRPHLSRWPRPAPKRAQARPSTLIKATNGAIYTTAQAKQGEAIYTQSCASCHGTNLQGVAAPAIAGKDFLGTAQKNGWTIGILRTIVTENMPFNNPGSLTAGQYAEVLAYLLAANCYPAGTTPFPEHATANLAHLKITEPSHLAGTPDRFGVCSVVP